MKKKLAVAALSNTIYLATVDKDGMFMSSPTREDMTDDVIKAMFTHMKTMYERDGKSRFIIKGVGEIKFTPEGETS